MPVHFPLRIGGGQQAVQQLVEPDGIRARSEFRGQRAVAGELEEFRLGFLGGGRGEDAGGEGMPAFGVQKTQGGEPVEPCVGDAFEEPGAVAFGLFAKGLDLGGACAEVGGVGAQDVIQLPGDGFLQQEPDLGRKRLQ